MTAGTRWQRLKQKLEDSAKAIGPGVVTGAADDDPSGVATHSQAGAQFGYGLLWTIPLTFPLVSAVQLICAHIGRVTGTGLGANLARAFPGWIVTFLLGLLLVANTINIGADLSAMAASLELVTGSGGHYFVFGFALLSTLLQLFIPYHRYARILKWLTLSLFAYVGVLLSVEVDWAATARGLVWPDSFDRDVLLTVVAVFGTTISPYLFFWQSSQEAEEITDHPGEKPLKDDPASAPREYRRMRFDTLLGMAFSNLIALAITIAAAATLHTEGITNVGTAADAAEALRPVAGDFAFALFALGIIGTGLLAIPVLAGAGAFAVSEARGWKAGLEYQPGQARGFYAVIVAAMLVGVALDWAEVDPIRALFLSAVLNGLCAVPIMVAMMLLATRRSVMGNLTISRPLFWLGWAATAIMAVASAAMLITQTAG
ncbi:MAG: divalent metal cation transporter [Croceibacterium sp.]